MKATIWCSPPPPVRLVQVGNAEISRRTTQPLPALHQLNRSRKAAIFVSRWPRLPDRGCDCFLRAFLLLGPWKV
ncbi:hypothetical protein BHE74_00023575 [Ensete ventricosum]|nr:hypothetical protein GW17_00049747 [Ensete ventricosum]RWW68876.1 hypothetical protein BHE74_00023575 [Ensete ventricosum]